MKNNRINLHKTFFGISLGIIPIIVPQNLTTKHKHLVEIGIRNRFVARLWRDKLQKANKKIENDIEKCTSANRQLPTANQWVTSRYKKYCSPIPVDFSGISDGFL